MIFVDATRKNYAQRNERSHTKWISVFWHQDQYGASKRTRHFALIASSTTTGRARSHKNVELQCLHSVQRAWSVKAIVPNDHMHMVQVFPFASLSAAQVQLLLCERYAIG